jgi:predicted small lipoprotein YifL
MKICNIIIFILILSLSGCGRKGNLLPPPDSGLKITLNKTIWFVLK